MVVLVVLLVSLVLFGGLGALGVGTLSTWHEVVAWALATMFLFTASSHFTRTREDLIAMVPGVFPKPALLVSLTGFLEGLGAVGLMIPATRGLAGLCLETSPKIAGRIAGATLAGNLATRVARLPRCKRTA